MNNRQPNSPSSCWSIYVDGAARGNPGPAGAGIYIISGEEHALKEGFFLKTKTNNQAEYLALVIALYRISTLKTAKPSSLIIYADSQLLVRQLQGIYKVKNPILAELKKVISTLLIPYTYTFVHIRREANGIADKLANQGIDTKELVPRELLSLTKNVPLEL